jgi:hypothetical protein
MSRKDRPSRGAPRAARAGSTPTSLSDERLARSDRGKLFSDDGRKVRDIERVGAMAPDTDPPDSGPRTYPPLRSKPRRSRPVP